MRAMVQAAAIGAGATLCIDLWAMLLRRGFGVRSLDYCLLGRWVLHMTEGTFVHQAIAASAAKSHECAVGWIAHYGIGMAFALLLVQLVGEDWMARPTVLPALAFGIATVVVPFVTVQPAFGNGIAGWRTANPAAARWKSLATHAVFGAGLYVWAQLLSRLR